MKQIFVIVLAVLTLSACNGRGQKDKKKTQKDIEICVTSEEDEKEMQRVFDELEKFDTIIIEFYNQIETNPNKVIKQTEILINTLKTEPDSDCIRWNKLGDLYDLRAETFYRMGKYQNSIEEIYNNGKNHPDGIYPDGRRVINDKLLLTNTHYARLACNYVKLQDFQKAKTYLDSVKNYAIKDYVIANYYEVIGEKDRALQIYYEIKKEMSRNHSLKWEQDLYQGSLMRIEELNKPNPKLLTELFYSSHRPDNKGM